MRLIYEGDGFVQTILGKKKVAAGAAYRWSDYAAAHECDGKQYLYNNFTKRIYLLEDERLDTLNTDRFTEETVKGDGALRELVTYHFLVPVEKDETDTYRSFCRIARALKMKKEGYTGFTILPTTSCNARCVYCYEEGIRFITMNEDTVAQTIEFIKKVRNPGKPVGFSWFGGEPLIGEKMIDSICAGMKEAGIEYSARMTTNGSLITSDIVRKMRGDWNVKRIQITLDGVEEEYNRRKNYIFQYDSPYWHILSRIKMVNESGIHLNIRVNVDAGNIDGVPQMIGDLKSFIVDPRLITFDIAPLFDLQASENGLAIWDKSFEVGDWIEAQGFRIASHVSTKKAKYNFCMASSPYTSIVIAPDGRLYNCENIMSFDSVGDIRNGVTETAYIKALDEVEPAREMCRGCFSLPQCTTFSRCGHPRVDCKYAARRRLERALDKMIRSCTAKQAEEEENEQEQDC